MVRLVLPPVVFAAVLSGLIAGEPPPSPEDRRERERQATLRGIEEEARDLIERIDRLERERSRRAIELEALEEHRGGQAKGLRESMERLAARREHERRVAEEEVARLDVELAALEVRAEGWVRVAYGLSVEALPPGVLARALWRADAAALSETSAIAKQLRATLHISERTSLTAAGKVKRFLQKPYTRRTFVSLAASLATISLIESSEPVLGAVLERRWKIAIAAAAGLLTLGIVVFLQERELAD